MNALCNVEVTVYNAFPDIKTVTSKRISLLKIRGERERDWTLEKQACYDKKSEKIINCWKINRRRREEKKIGRKYESKTDEIPNFYIFTRRKRKFYFILFYFISFRSSILRTLRTIAKENVISFPSAQSQIQILPDIPSNTAILEFSLWKSFWRNTGVITTRINALSVENSARIRGF